MYLFIELILLNKTNHFSSSLEGKIKASSVTPSSPSNPSSDGSVLGFSFLRCPANHPSAPPITPLADVTAAVVTVENPTTPRKEIRIMDLCMAWLI